MLHWLEMIVFVIILCLTVYGFFKPLYLRYRLIRRGKEENRFDKPFTRIKEAVFAFFFLTCSVKRERLFTGFVHFFFLYGSLTFDTVSVNHILEGFSADANFFGHGLIRSLHSAWADIFGIMVLLAVLYFLVRRYIVRPRSYTYPCRESLWIYALLITVTLTFFLYEGAAIAYKPGHTYQAFAGRLIADWLTGIMPVGLTLVKIMWWVHILNVFAFVLYVPRSKYLHMMAGPINIAFQDRDSKAAIKPMDIENTETYGVVKITDLTWKDLLDGFACIDCGRCDDYCPANRSDKPLSPKKLILKIKDYLLSRQTLLLSKAELPNLMADTYTDDEIWTCTTCGACMHVCPVKNEHLPKIFGLRQSRVLMEAHFPEELQPFFKNMETNANPWGFGSSTRADWAAGLDVKTLAEDPDVDILYWVGCAGSFDERGKKVAASLVKILKAASVRFGILGLEEGCCGDQARRLGHEYLFQVMAQQNIETLQKYRVKKILVTCPHGLHTFRNEYPAFARMKGLGAWSVEVIHHSQFIADLVRQGKLPLRQKPAETVTFHDPCYLARHNHIQQPPRDILSRLGARVKEMDDHHYHSLCCGAGGGLMWTEEKLGRRINHIRTDEALKTGVRTIATACPFCLTMMEDGVKDRGKEGERRVKDIAELVAECLPA